MIRGVTNDNLEAVVPIVLLGTNGQRQQLEAVIDTGFSGLLTLPPLVIEPLALEWAGQGELVLADGSTAIVEVYYVTIIWDGQPRALEIDIVDAAPLIGMKLLDGYELHIEVRDGGTVTIQALP